MQSQAERLASLTKAERDAIIDSFTPAQLDDLARDWRGFNGRPDQVAPDGDWAVWLVLAGRGWGKTEAGAQWVKERVDAGAMAIALIAETQKDLEEVMVPRLLGLYDRQNAPRVSMRPVRITWPSGARALGYVGNEPDQLRGPEFDTAWIDELAKYRRGQQTWDMLQFALRGTALRPRVMVTTTPRPTDIIKRLAKASGTHLTRGRTMDNAANLPVEFIAEMKSMYQGTRLGRQELDAEILGDIPGALWSATQLDTYRIKDAPETGRVVVAVDPAITNTENSDYHGIVVAGLVNGGEPRGVVLDDASMRGGPLDWARRAVSLYRSWGADCIVVETNQGGDMVVQTIRTIDPMVPIRRVVATRGKHVRAEPISSLYEQGRISHLGFFPELEAQMTQFTSAGYEGTGSPDRVDALVWAFTDLFPGMTMQKPVVQPYIPQPRYGLGARR